MKKLLALVLALVMVLGLATVGANAALKDYSDADSIDADYKEAFTVMNAVGVFQGSDGKLTPTDKLTRAQAAKLIAYLDLGGDVAETLPEVQVFADVPATHWAAKYVAYCQQAGIIQGAEANKFYPDGELTGYAFGAYLLAVLGYDRNLEGITGSDWQIKAASLMGDAGIGDGVEKAGSVALTREEAAQYCLETLEAPVVAYADKGTSVTTGETTVTVGAKAASYVTTGNYRATITDETGTDVLQLGEKLYKGTLTLTANGDVDAFGNPADVWRYKGVKIGTFNSKDAAITYTENKNTASGQAAVKADIKDFTNYGSSDVTLYTNGVKTPNTTLNEATVAGYTENGTVVKLFVTSNTVTTVTVMDTYLGKVTKVDDTAKELTITNLSTNTTGLKTEEGYGTFAKNDYVLITISNGDIATVEAPTKVTGIASTKNTSSNTITIDGTAYKQSANVVATKNVAAFKVSNTYDATLLLDKNNFILSAEAGAAVGTDKAVAVLENGTTLNDDNVLIDIIKGVTSDGETVTWKVGAYGTADLATNSVYSYAANTPTTGNYKLTKVTSTTTLATADTSETYVVQGSAPTGGISSSTKTLTVKDRVFYLRDNTNFIFVSGGKATVKSGAQTVPAGTTIYVAYDLGNDGLYYATAVYAMTAAAVASTSSDAVVFVQGKTTGDYQVTGTNNKTVTLKTYNAWIDGTSVSGFFAKDGAATGFYSVSNSDVTGEYLLTSATKYTATSGTAAVTASAQNIKAVANNILTTTGGVDYSIGDATIVDTTGTKAYDTYAELEELTDYSNIAVYIMYNSTGKVASTVYVVANTSFAAGDTPTVADVKEALLSTGTATIDTTSGTVALTGTLDVPAGTTLTVEGTGKITATAVTIEGAVSGDDAEIESADITIKGNDAIVDVKEIDATTSGFLVLDNGAKVTAETVTADSAVVGCELTVDVLQANTVVILGDEGSNKLTVNEKLVAKSGSGAVATIYLLGDSSTLVINADGNATASTITNLYVGHASGSALTLNSVTYAADANVPATGAVVQVKDDDNAPTFTNLTLVTTSDVTLKGEMTVNTSITDTANSKITIDGTLNTPDGMSYSGTVALESDAVLKQNDSGSDTLAVAKLVVNGDALIDGTTDADTVTVTELTIKEGATLTVGSAVDNNLTFSTSAPSIGYDGANTALVVKGALTTGGTKAQKEAQMLALATTINFSTAAAASAANNTVGATGTKTYATVTLPAAPKVIFGSIVDTGLGMSDTGKTLVTWDYKTMYPDWTTSYVFKTDAQTTAAAIDWSSSISGSSTFASKPTGLTETSVDLWGITGNNELTIALAASASATTYKEIVIPFKTAWGAALS